MLHQTPATGLSARAARTRAALLAAGYDLLSARTIDAVAIDEIVAAAGVAKGSFFNHFEDKGAYAAALARDIRLEVEARVAAANADVTDPVERLARGMAVAAHFAARERTRTLVLLRTFEGVTAADHPLNAGVAADMRAAVAAGGVREEAGRWGVLYWLGLCHALMIDISQRSRTGVATSRALSVIMQMGLAGLGVPRAKVARIVRTSGALLSS